MTNDSQTPPLSGSVGEDTPNLKQCSFCGRDKNAVVRLVAGQGNVYICNYCITLSVDLLIHYHEKDIAAMRERQAKVIAFYPETEAEVKS